MAGVFLAHSSADKRFVRRLAADLLKNGVRVWFDEAEMLVGDSLFKKIEQGIGEMDFMAVVLSPASVSSKWVQRELEIALSQEIEHSAVKVLPILYKLCDVPAFLRPKLWLDFSNPRNYSSSFVKLLKRVAPHKVKSSVIFVSWTPKAVRLGMLCGLVVTKAGNVELADAFLQNLREVGQSWIKGTIDIADQGELVAHAAARTIADPQKRETIIPLSMDETHYLFSHLSRQILNDILDLSAKAKILTLNDRRVALCQDLTNEVIETIGTHAASGIRREKDVRPFVLKLFEDTVRARLMLYAPNKIGYCEQVAMLAFSMFEDSEPYRDLKRIVRQMSLGRKTP